MNYLEELKKRVAAAFENATGKEDIDNLSSINTTIGLVEQEQNQHCNGKGMEVCT